MRVSASGGCASGSYLEAAWTFQPFQSSGQGFSSPLGAQRKVIQRYSSRFRLGAKCFLLFYCLAAI